MDRRAQPKQPFPTTGRLVRGLDPALEQLQDDIADRTGSVYVYVVDSARHFEQLGCSPNWQGGLITLCACKRRDRTRPRFAPGKRLWVAGITPSDHRRRYLLYLMLVRDRFESQVELSKSLPEEARAAKWASRHQLGDVYEPKRVQLVGDARFDVLNYYEPCEEHTHRTKNEWYLDINYPGGRPWMLVGDPRFSYIWSEPSIRF